MDIFSLETQKNDGELAIGLIAPFSLVWSVVLDGVTTTYGYDNADQLTSEGNGMYSISYTYDANGNRATRVLNGVTETYTNDSGDKLNSVTWSGGSKTYGYDAAGRTTSVVTSAGTTTLAYDCESRVSTITYPGSSTNTFTYNGLDTRVGKVDSGGTKTFFRSGVGVTDPVLSDSAAVYTAGVSERRGSTTTFSHSGVKNADLQTSTSQVSTGTRNYDAFGNVVASSGTWSGPFGYAGKFGYQEDSDSGLKLLGHRYYDATTGRFITRDPAKAGRNWYGYCDGDPLGSFDPDGKKRVYAFKTQVFGPGWHLGLYITDNDGTNGQVIEGGPVENPGGLPLSIGHIKRQRLGKLIDKVLISTDNQSVTDFIKYDSISILYAANDEPSAYKIITSNSNLFASKIAGLMKLSEAFDNAVQKWLGFGVWFPGYEKMKYCYPEDSFPDWRRK